MAKVKYTPKGKMAGGKRKGKKTERKTGQKPKQVDPRRTKKQVVREKDVEKSVASFFEGTKRRQTSDDRVDSVRALSSHSDEGSLRRRPHTSSSDGSLTGGAHVQSERKRRKAESEGSSVGKGRDGGGERRGRRGEKGEVGVSSESGGEGEGEGGERVKVRGRKRFREVRISNAVVAKWKPVSMATRDLLSGAMVSALGQCLEGVRGTTRRHAESAIQQVMQQVENKVAAVKAPPTKRMKSSSDLKQRVAELKEKCIDLVRRNEDLTQRMEERQLFCDEKRETTQQLGTVAETQLQSDHIHPPAAVSPLAGSEDESFKAYIQDLVSPTPLNSLTSIHSILGQETTPSL